MIKPKCIYCNKELKEFGGIILSNPDHLGFVKKDHLCVWCYMKSMPNYKQYIDKRLEMDGLNREQLYKHIDYLVDSIAERKSKVVHTEDIASYAFDLKVACDSMLDRFET